MANSPVKYRKTPEPQRKDYFTEWKVEKEYLAGSIVTYGDDAYIVRREYTSTNDFNADLAVDDIELGKFLQRIAPPSVGGSWYLGPYYTRSGNSRRGPTTSHGVKWKGSQYYLYRVRIIGAGGGDLNDGGYPWTSYNYYLYFRKINT
jgi:hypothetical protein